jgi:hypothetical protein
MAASTDPAPPSAVPSAAPWWVPPWSVWLGGGLFAMTWWIMWLLAPAAGKEASQLFNMLAQAIVLTAFIGGVVATVYTATRESQKKNDTIAAQAAAIAAQQTNSSTGG